MIIAAGTSPSIDIQIVDDNGLAVNSLVAATVTATVKYAINGLTDSVTITLSDLSLITSPYSSGGIKAKAGSAGHYRLDLPAAAVATAGTQVTVFGETSGQHIICAAIDVTPAVGTVTSVSGSVGSVTGSVGSVTGSVGSISGVTFPTNFSSFSLDSSGRVLLQPTQTGVVIPSVTTVTGNLNGNVAGSVASVTGNVGGNITGSVASVVGAVGSVTGSVGSVAGSLGGDVSGKVLGGGSGTITGDGVRASSVSGSVASVTGAVGSVTGAVGSVSGSISGDVAGKVLGGGGSSITGAGVRADQVTGSVGSVVGSVGSVTGSVGSVTGSVGSVTGAVGSVTAMVSANATQFAGTSTTGILSAAGVFSAAALANAPTGSSGGSGSYNVTLTITDGTNPLPNATVTLAINASRYTAVTNSSGVAVLTPTEGNGTYTVSLTAIGYQFTPASLTVSGNTSHSYAMAQITITPATAPAATGWLVVTQSDGVTPEVGQIVNFRMIAVPPDSTGLAPDPTIFPVTSIAGGMVQASFLGLATYQMKTGRQQNWSTFVAGASGTTFAIQSALI